jgi:hypothetical protein
MKALRRLLAVALSLSLPLVALAQAAAAPEAAKPADPPKISITPYGIASLALYKDSGVFANQDYPNYALSEDEGAMVLSARQSRFGVNASVPMENLLGATVTGKIEFDVMAPGVFTSAPMRLRHAFMTAPLRPDGQPAPLPAPGVDLLPRQPAVPAGRQHPPPHPATPPRL